jgi:6-pyruvoyl-tetrahydropterin synthase
VAEYIFKELDGQFNDAFGTGLRLHSVKLWETPTSCAIYGVNDK